MRKPFYGSVPGIQKIQMGDPPGFAYKNGPVRTSHHAVGLKAGPGIVGHPVYIQ